MVESWVVRHGFLAARRADAFTVRAAPGGLWRAVPMAGGGHALGATPEAALGLWAALAGWRCVCVTPLARSVGVVR